MTLITFDASRLIVFAMTAPQPSRNARVMTFRFVPGGPEPITNGFGSFSPSTAVASVAILASLAKPRLVSLWAARFDTKMPGARLPDPPHRLFGELVERGHGEFEMFSLRVLDLIVTNAAKTLDKHHDCWHARARDFGRVVQRTGRQSMRFDARFRNRCVGHRDQLIIK